jgi:hypothetical protein
MNSMFDKSVLEVLARSADRTHIFKEFNDDGFNPVFNRDGFVLMHKITDKGIYKYQVLSPNNTIISIEGFEKKLIDLDDFIRLITDFKADDFLTKIRSK